MMVPKTWPGPATPEAAIARVAERFGIPALAVRELACLPAATLIQRTEAAYAIPVNGEVPAAFEEYPLGSVRVADFGGDVDNRYVDYLHEFDAATLLLAEAEQGIKRHPSYARYLTWAREGRRPPYINVFETDRGSLQSSNRRRTLVAQELGQSIQGWFGRTNQETGLPLKYGDLQQALDQARQELAAGQLMAQVFHITPARNLPDILRDGLRPMLGERSRQAGERTPVTFVFVSPAALEDGLVNWLGEQFDDDDPLALLGIQNTRVETSPQAVYEGLIRETIPPSRITLISSNIDAEPHLMQRVDRRPLLPQGAAPSF